MARNWHIKGENIAEGPEKEDDFMMRDTGCPSKMLENRNDMKVIGVVSLKRLLNQSILKSWSSKMIKKSLEAYFFTLKNKIVFCKKQF